MTDARARPPRRDLLDLVDAGVGVRAVLFDRWSEWAVLDMPRFAGPATRLRAVALADDVGVAGVRRGDTFEASDDAEHRRDLAIVVDAGAATLRTLHIEPSAGGATVGELVDETARQGALIDASIAVALLPPPLATAARTMPAWSRAESADQLLVGFDGVVRRRGHLPWWPEPRRLLYPRAYLSVHDAEIDGARTLRDLVATLFASTRPRGAPTAEGVHDDAAIQALVPLLARHGAKVAAAAADVVRVAALADARPAFAVARELAAVHAALVDAAPPAPRERVADVVRALFPERWRNEQRVREAVLGERA